MRFTVIFHPEARDEALNAADFIAEHSSPAMALRWYEALETAIESLSNMPNRCEFARESDTFPNEELRQLVFKSHRLIFTIRGKEVHVLHLRHTSRDNLNSLQDS